jgi:hypothetical protein
MKNLLILFSVALIGLLACKKDTPLTAFDKATYADILQNEPMFSTQAVILVKDANGLNPGAIIFYKTGDGTYGKLKIVSSGEGANPSLTIDIVNFKNDGKVLSRYNNVVIASTNNNACDLETGLKYGGPNNFSDFFWGAPSFTDYSITPQHGAGFYVFLKP